MARCKLLEEGFPQGSCTTYTSSGKGPACEITLRFRDGIPERLIVSAHLSRPEHYFSIYQSGCNLSCLKCHSWQFTQYADGRWLSPQQVVSLAAEYAEMVTVWEPRSRATSFHALDLCRGCGTCVQVTASSGFGSAIALRPTGRRSPLCPGKVSPEQILLSPQGLGPARNIIAFTGGDLMCQPDFYLRSTEGIKALGKGLWVLLETNGYGLTPRNLDLYREAGVDAFWLDIKAYDPEVHKRLTGVENRWILRLPEEIRARGFTLEVLTLYIPGWVEVDQIERIARLLSAVDPSIPFTILAFFPQYKMRDVPPPSLDQMLSAYEAVRAVGLEAVRLGNPGVFLKGERDWEKLLSVAPEAI
ncbi:MAG: radical SAM protein [Deltaproteobacteria bacterium]|nr:MAG: radical SAM protein [Deltaproteobacteria bacterium]